MHFRLGILIAGLLLSPLTMAVGVLPGSSGNTADQGAVYIPEDLSEEQVGDFVAPLDEQQVRSLLINQLEKEAQENSLANATQSVSIVEMLKGIRNPYTPLGGGVAAMINATGTLPEKVSDVLNTITGEQGMSGFFELLGILLIVTLISWLVEYGCLYQWHKKRGQRSNSDDTSSWQEKIKHPFVRFLQNFIGLTIFTIAGYIVLGFFVSDQSKEYEVLERLFDSIIVYRFFLMVAKTLMNSPPEGLDLIDDTINKSALMKCIAIFLFFYNIVFIGFVNTLFDNGLPATHYILTAAIVFGLAINPLIIGFVWLQRYDIDRILFGDANEQVNRTNEYRYAARAAIWPTVVTCVVLLVFVMWQVLTLTGNTSQREFVERAWWLAILFPLVDLMVSSLLNKLTSLEIFQVKRFQQRKQRFIFIVRNIVRLVLITILLLNILSAWGVDLINRFNNANRDFATILVDIGGTLVIGFLIWEAVQLWMERKLPDAPEEEVTEIEGEGGGAAATRTETLLPLLRTTLLIVLFLVVVMSVLYSLGVQIAPLLAGAGVLGIAIGFGAQKLVQDIISGVFFLIDDAFRKGEYVEVAGMRGTVEKLSVRSMTLRHHLGAVQTIPYGEIATVRNLSRDWVIMKLELRLPYDVDIEKVRKIIKKVGQEMMQDEEIGPNMLQPLKSQGVMRVEESALIFRMKFTAKPGEQWVVRRMAYTRVRDALSAAGIEFAHREVKVRLPAALENLQKLDYERKLSEKGDTESESETSPSEASTQSATIAAAAMSAVVAKELAAQEKIDDIDDGGDDDR